MAAAVADFRPTDVGDAKLKKGTAGEPSSIALERTTDVLRDVAGYDAARIDALRSAGVIL